MSQRAHTQIDERTFEYPARWLYTILTSNRVYIDTGIQRESPRTQTGEQVGEQASKRTRKFFSLISFFFPSFFFSLFLLFILSPFHSFFLLLFLSHLLSLEHGKLSVCLLLCHFYTSKSDKPKKYSEREHRSGGRRETGQLEGFHTKVAKQRLQLQVMA